MATSGVRQFNPQFAELLSEAFSRIQIRPAAVTQDHIVEAVRSANLMFVSFANRVQHQFQLQEVTQALTASDPTYDLPAGGLDVWSAVVRKDGVDTPVWPMARVDYQRIPSKTQEGRPFNYFVERGKVGNTRRTITFWPTPDGTSADEAIMWVLMRPEDATGLPENISVAWEWFDAYACDLTARLAEKYAPELYDGKSIMAERAFLSAKGADRERAPTRFRMRGYGRTRRR
jgi:hypothetical protein